MAWKVFQPPPLNNPQFHPSQGCKTEIENEGIEVTIMETNPTHINPEYDPDGIDSLLAQFGDDVEAGAARYALAALTEHSTAQRSTPDTPVPSDEPTAIPVQPISEIDRQAALALERQMKTLTDALRTGNLELFMRLFSEAHRTPESEHGNVAIAWLITYASSDLFVQHPEIAAWLLTKSMTTLLEVPAKWRLGLLSHLARSPKFVLTPEWLAYASQLDSDVAFEHIVKMLAVNEKMHEATSGSAFIQCAPFLKRLSDTDRMELARQAFTACELPSQWARLALSVGFSKHQIGELIALRCELIKQTHLLELLSENDQAFLDELLTPAPTDGVSYRSALDDEQLQLVVFVVRTRHPRRDFSQIQGAIRRLCLGTMNRRYRRL